MVKISILSALSEGYPGRFPSQSAGNAEPLGKHRHRVKNVCSVKMAMNRLCPRHPYMRRQRMT